MQFSAATHMSIIKYKQSFMENKIFNNNIIIGTPIKSEYIKYVPNIYILTIECEYTFIALKMNDILYILMSLYYNIHLCVSKMQINGIYMYETDNTLRKIPNNENFYANIPVHEFVTTVERQLLKIIAEYTTWKIHSFEFVFYYSAETNMSAICYFNNSILRKGLIKIISDRNFLNYIRISADNYIEACLFYEKIRECGINITYTPKK